MDRPRMHRYPGGEDSVRPWSPARAARPWAGLMVLLWGLGFCALLSPGQAQACSLKRANAPQGRMLLALSHDCDEESLLAPGRRPALYAVADSQGHYQRTRPAAVLVHGLAGHPADLSLLAEQLERAGYQPYALFFDDMGRYVRDNGSGLAAAIAGLSRSHLERGQDLIVVAHSAGGLIARLAINLLAAAGELRRFGEVHLYAIDTPWHGYVGPSDATMLGRLRMRLVQPFMPDGMEDLRAESALFAGDPTSDNPALARGLLRYPLPPEVHVHLCFAQQGNQVQDYTEGLLSQLSEHIAAYYQFARPVRGEARLQNFWFALISADVYFAFQDELRGLADRGLLDAERVRQALLRHFPRHPGDHVSILRGVSENGQLILMTQLLPALLRGTTAMPSTELL